MTELQASKVKKQHYKSPFRKGVRPGRGWSIYCKACYENGNVIVEDRNGVNIELEKALVL